MCTFYPHLLGYPSALHLSPHLSEACILLSPLCGYHHKVFTYPPFACGEEKQRGGRWSRCQPGRVVFLSLATLLRPSLCGWVVGVREMGRVAVTCVIGLLLLIIGLSYFRTLTPPVIRTSQRGASTTICLSDDGHLLISNLPTIERVVTFSKRGRKTRTKSDVCFYRPQ